MKNKVCVCGSEKKPKYCCGDCLEVINWIKKDDTLIRGESYWIMFKPLSPDIEPADKGQYQSAIRYFENNNIIKALGGLERLLVKYTTEYRISHNLACMYLLVNRKEEGYAIFEKNYKEHPEYIFSKIMLGRHYLDQNKPEKIPEMFNNKFDLKSLYPERKVFHVSEFTALSLLMGLYFCKIKQFDKAEIFLNGLKGLNAEEGDVLEKHIKLQKIKNEKKVKNAENNA